MQDLHLADAFTPEPMRVGVVCDLQNPTPDIRGVASEELLDIVAVHREPAVEAKLSAKGLETSEMPEAHVARRWTIVAP
jgi:hypothetical protein